MSEVKIYNDCLVRAVRGVLSQGERSVGGWGSTCKYRGGHGLKCAVGWLIPYDDDARRADDLLMSPRRVLEAGSFDADVTTDDIHNLEMLQECHDKASVPSSFDADFRGQVASRLPGLLEQAAAE